MYLRALYLRNFRSFKESLFEFSPHGNSISGENAKGKTTLLEAIYFLATGNSFRASNLTDLIQLGKDSFYLEAILVKHGIEQSLKIVWGKEEKQFYHNNNKCPLANLLGILQSVVIAPEEIALVRGGPHVRRRFLDLHIAQNDPLYVHHLTRYIRAMKQRNVLLKTKKLASIESWEHEMAKSAAYLFIQRLNATKEIEKKSQEVHYILTDQREQLHIHYHSNPPQTASQEEVKSFYLAQFNHLRKKEQAFGFTLVGPHKDELVISIGEKPARFFASEGQQRSCVAAIKLAEWNRLHTSLDGLKPLMLIDDIGVSLDDNRRAKLLSYLETLGQTFLTSTEEVRLPFPTEQKKLYLK